MYHEHHEGESNDSNAECNSWFHERYSNHEYEFLGSWSNRLWLITEEYTDKSKENDENDSKGKSES